VGHVENSGWVELKEDGEGMKAERGWGRQKVGRDERLKGGVGRI
jgi:hypothetical protein